MRVAPLLAALLLAGCLAPPEEDGRWMFGGSFRGDATRAEREELLHHLGTLAPRVEVSADDPTSQFGAGQMRKATCEEARAYAASKPYVREARPCVPDPNEP